MNAHLKAIRINKLIIVSLVFTFSLVLYVTIGTIRYLNDGYHRIGQVVLVVNQPAEILADLPPSSQPWRVRFQVVPAAHNTQGLSATDTVVVKLRNTSNHPLSLSSFDNKVSSEIGVSDVSVTYNGNLQDMLVKGGGSEGNFMVASDGKHRIKFQLSLTLSSSAVGRRSINVSAVRSIELF